MNRSLLAATAFSVALHLLGPQLLADEMHMTPYSDPQGRFSLIMPEGWQTHIADPLVSLTSPEGDIVLWFGLSGLTDPADAVAAAWTAAGEVAPDPQMIVPAPTREGFDKATAFVYPPEGGQFRQAVVEERGHQLYVTLIRGGLVALERRGAQVNIAVTGFRPTDAVNADVAGVVADQLDAVDLAGLGTYVEENLARFDVPGAVVAVVQDGKVLMVQGFGLRAAGKPAPVTPDTRMMIGSVGKSMTTLLMAQLVEEGLLAWDQPVREILPDFAVADPELSETIRVENLVCACSGVPRRDMEFLFNARELDAEAVIASLAGFEFFTSFGEAFQYSNQLVATGGWVAAAAAGARWGELDEGYISALDRHLFKPLGMARSTLDFAEVLADGDYAVPHAPHGTGHRRGLDVETEAALLPVAPAGAHWSTGADMARYLQALLALGKGGGLIMPESFVHLTTPQVPVSASMSYGLGWFVETWRGQRLIHHGGNTFGFTSELAFLPDAGAGIVILTNAGRANDFVQAVRARFLEILFDQPHSHHEGALITRTEAARQAAVLAGATPIPSGPAHAAEGRYHSPVLGEVSLVHERGRLVLDIGELSGELRVDPRQPGRWIIWEGPLFTQAITYDPETRVLTFGEGATAYDLVPME